MAGIMNEPRQEREAGDADPGALGDRDRARPGGQAAQHRGQVAGDGQGSAAGGADPGARRFGRTRVAVDRDVGARLGQGDGDLRPRPREAPVTRATRPAREKTELIPALDPDPGPIRRQRTPAGR
jgi:hypothetical protein